MVCRFIGQSVGSASQNFVVTGHCVSAASHQFMTKVHDWFALLCSKHTFKLMLETVHSRFPYPEERQRERDRASKRWNDMKNSSSRSEVPLYMISLHSK